MLQVLVGQNAIMATPAMSALIRRRKLYGMSMSATLALQLDLAAVGQGISLGLAHPSSANAKAQFAYGFQLRPLLPGRP